MRFSEHFLNYRMEIRPYVSLAQAVAVVNNPVRFEVQNDGRTRYWGLVPEEGRYIRVVVEADGETIVTAFKDRRFRP